MSQSILENTTTEYIQIFTILNRCRMFNKIVNFDNSDSIIDITHIFILLHPLQFHMIF